MKLLTINVGKTAPLFAGPPDATAEPRHQVLSGIRKNPVSTLGQPNPVRVGPLGLAGDEQADLTVHGGRDKAVYAYPIEHYPVWRTMRQQACGRDEELPHGSFGENLTISGLLETQLWIGDQLIFGDGAVRLRVASPRSPCFKFNAVMGFRQASAMMVQSGYTGFYLEVMQEGLLRAGDEIQLVPGDRHMRVEELHRMNTRSKQRKLF